MLSNRIESIDEVLPIGADVSAKWRGAFCEAKIVDIDRKIEIQVERSPHPQQQQKPIVAASGLSLDSILRRKSRSKTESIDSFSSSTFFVKESAIIVDNSSDNSAIRFGKIVKCRMPNDSSLVTPVKIKTIVDRSLYTVKFDDGDNATLIRSKLCPRSGKHFSATSTLEQQPLGNPEEFSKPAKKSSNHKEELGVQENCASFPNRRTRTKNDKIPSTSSSSAAASSLICEMEMQENVSNRNDYASSDVPQANDDDDEEHVDRLPPGTVINVGDRLRVRCYCGRSIKPYEAIVLKCDFSVRLNQRNDRANYHDEAYDDDQQWAAAAKPVYFIHYPCWHSRYDEWIGRGRIECILPPKKRGKIPKSKPNKRRAVDCESVFVKDENKVKVDSKNKNFNSEEVEVKEAGHMTASATHCLDDISPIDGAAEVVAKSSQAPKAVDNRADDDNHDGVVAENSKIDLENDSKNWQKSSPKNVADNVETKEVLEEEAIEAEEIAKSEKETATPIGTLALILDDISSIEYSSSGGDCEDQILPATNHSFVIDQQQKNNEISVRINSEMMIDGSDGDDSREACQRSKSTDLGYFGNLDDKKSHDADIVEDSWAELSSISTSPVSVPPLNDFEMICDNDSLRCDEMVPSSPITATANIGNDSSVYINTKFSSFFISSPSSIPPPPLSPTLSSSSTFDTSIHAKSFDHLPRHVYQYYYNNQRYYPYHYQLQQQEINIEQRHQQQSVIDLSQPIGNRNHRGDEDDDFIDNGGKTISTEPQRIEQAIEIDSDREGYNIIQNSKLNLDILRTAATSALLRTDKLSNDVSVAKKQKKKNLPKISLETIEEEAENTKSGHVGHTIHRSTPTPTSTSATDRLAKMDCNDDVDNRSSCKTTTTTFATARMKQIMENCRHYYYRDSNQREPKVPHCVRFDYSQWMKRYDIGKYQHLAPLDVATTTSAERMRILEERMRMVRMKRDEQLLRIKMATELKTTKKRGKKRMTKRSKKNRKDAAHCDPENRLPQHCSTSTSVLSDDEDDKIGSL